MKNLPCRPDATKHCYPPPWSPIEKASEELLLHTAAAMREAWPELTDTTSAFAW
ncbi:hypothetical protein [Nocardia sp. NPDC057353]|uniref:hypothetical protein n=1 Tax=Nocardia sp. NPDC057353 TaxID=3346104 RepID=UPI0036351B43